MKDESGEQIACANSIWVYMDVEKGKPVRVDKEQAEAYGIDEPLEMPYEDRKIEEAESYEEKAPFTNHHVNNCQYVQMALEVLPRDILVSQVRVDYKKSAVLGDKIFPETAQKKDRVIVRLCDEDRKPYAVIEFKTGCRS